MIASITNRPSSTTGPLFDITELEHRNRISPALVDKVNHLDYSDIFGFITGMSFRASYEGGPFFTLFISIPSLGLAQVPSPSLLWNSATPAEEVGELLAGSRTLQEYRLQHLLKGTADSGSAIKVHQTRFSSLIVVRFLLAPSAVVLHGKY